MELKIRDGQYTLSAAGVPESVNGTEEILQRVLMRLAARRGAFWPDPDYGSRLYTLPQIRPAQRSAAASLFVAEALTAETDVTVESVSYVPGEDGNAAVTAALSVSGTRTEITIEV